MIYPFAPRSTSNPLGCSRSMAFDASKLSDGAAVGPSARNQTATLKGPLPVTCSLTETTRSRADLVVDERLGHVPDPVAVVVQPLEPEVQLRPDEHLSADDSHEAQLTRRPHCLSLTAVTLGRRSALPCRRTMWAMAASSPTSITVNRAPVMTLWAAVVAERLGYDRDAALTMGRVVAGLNANSKAKRLGLIDPEKKPKEKTRQSGERHEIVELLGRSVPIEKAKGGAVRAVSGNKSVTPASVEAYLKRSFGDDLGRVREAMERLAGSREPEALGPEAYDLYEQFRPAVPAGTRGWGAKGKLYLSGVKALAAKRE